MSWCFDFLQSQIWTWSLVCGAHWSLKGTCGLMPYGFFRSSECCFKTMVGAENPWEVGNCSLGVFLPRSYCFSWRRESQDTPTLISCFQVNSLYYLPHTLRIMVSPSLLLLLTWHNLPMMFSSVQSLSRVWLFPIPWIAASQASLSITIIISWSLLKLMSIKLVMPSNHLILGHPLLLLPSIFPSIRVFSNESALHNRWPKYWSFRISPSNEYSGLISFWIDWFDLLAVHGTLKSLLQHHSSEASILWRLAFFMIQLSHPYMTIQKTIALIIWTSSKDNH